MIPEWAAGSVDRVVRKFGMRRFPLGTVVEISVPLGIVVEISDPLVIDIHWLGKGRRQRGIAVNAWSWVWSPLPGESRRCSINYADRYHSSG